MTDLDDSQHPDFITALARGLSVIRAFDKTHPRMTMADVAHRTGLPRATVRRSLFTLKALGYVAGDGKYFSLSPSILCLGYSYLGSTPLPGLIQPFLDEITAATGLSSSAAVYDGREIVYIARSASQRIMAIDLGVGSTLPAYCTSMGRVLLAALPPDRLTGYLGSVARPTLTPHTVTDELHLRQILDQTRRQGWAAVDQELELGLWSLSVPVRDQSGMVVAAMNVSQPATQAMGYEAVEHLLPILRHAAERLSPALPR